MNSEVGPQRITCTITSCIKFPRKSSVIETDISNERMKDEYDNLLKVTSIAGIQKLGSRCEGTFFLYY